jgi:hypothetical protein
MSNLDRMRKDLDRLIEEGDLLYARMLFGLSPVEMAKAHNTTPDHLSKKPSKVRCKLSALVFRVTRHALGTIT